MSVPTLEYLRIASEASEAVRRIDSEPGRRRRDEAIRRAARHHSVEDVAEAAGVASKYVVALLANREGDPTRRRRETRGDGGRIWARLLPQR